MAEHQELKLYQKAMDMLAYGYDRARQFPKSERHTMASDVRREMVALVVTIAQANRARDKSDIVSLRAAIVRPFVLPEDGVEGLIEVDLLARSKRLCVLSADRVVRPHIYDSCRRVRFGPIGNSTSTQGESRDFVWPIMFAGESC